MPQVFRLQLLAGTHEQDEIDKKGQKVLAPQEVFNPLTNKHETKQLPVGKKYAKDAYFFSLVNYAARWPEKFREVPEHEQPSALTDGGQEAPAAPPVSQGLTAQDLGHDFESMTIADLRQYAASEEIELGAAKTKAEIIAAIKAADE